MKLVTVLSAATLVVALGLTTAQPQAPGGLDQGRPPAAAPAGPDMGPGGHAGGGMWEDLGGPGLTGPKGDRPALEGAGKAEGELSAEGKAGTKSEGEVKPEGKAGTKAEGDVEAEGEAGAAAEREKPGKSDKSVRLESEQVSKVKTYFTEHKPKVKAVDKTKVRVSIGVALPSVIVLYDLPPDVIVVSEACPIKYFVWGDDIVLVDSCTREVVEIIVGVA